MAARGGVPAAHNGRSRTRAVKNLLMLSKLESQRNLADSRVGCRRILSEAGVRLASVCSKTRSRIECRKLRVAKRIVHFPANLKTHRFAHWDTFEDSHVPTVRPRQPQDVLACVTDRAHRGQGEHAGIECLTERALTCRQIWIPRHVYAGREAPVRDRQQIRPCTGTSREPVAEPW